MSAATAQTGGATGATTNAATSRPWPIEHEMIFLAAFEKYPPFASMMDFNIMNIAAVVNKYDLDRRFGVGRHHPNRLQRDRVYTLKDVHDHCCTVVDIHHDVSTVLLFISTAPDITPGTGRERRMGLFASIVCEEVSSLRAARRLSEGRRARLEQEVKTR
jgi:hypothetical protein